jgi:hypothetical protein
MPKKHSATVYVKRVSDDSQRSFVWKSLALTSRSPGARACCPAAQSTGSAFGEPDGRQLTKNAWFEGEPENFGRKMVQLSNSAGSRSMLEALRDAHFPHFRRFRARIQSTRSRRT